MSNLNDFREAVRSAVASGVGQFVKVETHGGRFDAEELKRWAKQAPCAVTSTLGVRSMRQEGGQNVVSLQLGVFVIARDTPGAKRDSLALTLVEAVLAVVTPSQRFADGYSHVPEGIRADNLFTGQLDAQGVALWAVTWQQDYDVHTFDPNTLDNFLRYRATDQLSSDADVPTAQDAVDLEAAP